MIFVNRLKLASRLQYQTCRDFTASYSSDKLLQIRNLSDICRLIDQASYMHRKSPVIHIIGLLAKKIEKLRIYHGDQEIERRVVVAHNEEQSRLLVSQGIKVRFVVRSNLTKL